MNIVVPIKLVPDLVEELEIDASGTALDTTWMSLILNEFDDHAIEEAVLIKERGEAQVTILAPDVADVDDVLYTAAARGADRLIRLVGDFEAGANNHTLARAFAATVAELQPDLVLTGVQAHNDLDGAVGPLLAEYLGMPYVGYVAGVSLSNGTVTVRKEYPGGLIAEMEVTLPAVLGIQAAEQPPRYVITSLIEAAEETATIEERSVVELDPTGAPAIARMFQPEGGQRATMIDGDAGEIAASLVEILREAGAL